MTELRTTRYVPPTPSPTKYVDRPLPPLPAGEATPQGTEFRPRTTSLHLPRRSGAVANPSMSASHSVGLQGGQHHPRLGAAIKQSHPNLNQHLSARGGVIRKPSHTHSNSRGSFLSMTDSEPAFETTEGSYTAYQSETASAKYSNKLSTENSTLEAPSKIPRLGIPTNPRPKKPKSLEALATRTREPPTPPTTITSWLVDDPLTPSLWVSDISQEASPTPPRSEHRPQIPFQPGYPARKRHPETTVTPGLRLLRTRAKFQPESRRSSSVRTNTMSPADSVDIIGELDKLKALIAESGRSQIVRPPTFVGRLEGN
ncbi:hypothetical protein BD779DRAFT_363778 [Infundibulicybe gibba]|nr:hypothetical protein BD779DRAFT_363778 [Infundibulicybe gibba]